MIIADVLAASAVLLGYVGEGPTCSDPLSMQLEDAGWTGTDNRIAWSIVMRESRNQPGTTWGGAYGLFQLQASAWSDAAWWDWSTVLTSEGNIKMAYSLWSEHGWMPWGITSDGLGMDVTQYGGWGTQTQYSWIWEPYKRFWDVYPC